MAAPWMTPNEIDYLARCVTPSMRVWEWGSGNSTHWFAERCRWLVSMEHDREWFKQLAGLPENVSALLCEPAPTWKGAPEDGTRDEFGAYVGMYFTPSDLVLIDGRARVGCAERVAEVGGDPIVFVHDCQRAEYAPIWETHLEEVGRVDNLMQLRRRS